MTIEAMPVGLRCNLKCSYCYQDPARAGDDARPYDVEAMKAALEETWRASGAPQGDAAYIVFGGEPLMTPIADLEAFLEHSWRLSGKSGVQTNAALMTEAHVALFKRYRTHVGVSMDGPGELNDARPSATQEATRAATEKSAAALLWLLEEKVPCSLIVTLHKANASRDRLPTLIAWLAGLRDKGLDDAKLHVMEVDSPAAVALALGEDEAVEALLTLHQAEPHVGLRFVLFEQMLALLTGRDEKVDCVWNGCDPGTTGAVRAVGPRGESLNCARTYKGPVMWQKAPAFSAARQLALYETPWEDGGCKGCRFFAMCKGQCPGEAIDGDPRNRSANCRIWFRVFEFLERRLLDTRVVAVSLRPDREAIESAMLSEWAEDRQVSVAKGVAIATGRLTARPDLGPDQHGDWHGDHADVGLLRRVV